MELFTLDVPAELAPYQDILAGAVLPSVVLTPAPVDGPLPALSTKVGGAPDLPPGAEWPCGPDGEQLPFQMQVNFTDLAARFPDLLPWPTGGGLLQLFIVGGGMDLALLVHRDLAALRPATPPVEPTEELRLDPSVEGCSYGEYPAVMEPLFALRNRLDQEQSPLRKVLDDWLRQFDRDPYDAQLQLGGGGLWIQDRGYADAWIKDWALEHGRDLFDFPFADRDEYDRKRNVLWDNARAQAQADGWQVVLNLLDEFGGYYLLAPPDAHGRWDLDRLQVLSQSQ